MTAARYRHPNAQWLGSPNYSPNRDGHDLVSDPRYIIMHTMVGTWQGANGLPGHARGGRARHSRAGDSRTQAATGSRMEVQPQIQRAVVPAGQAGLVDSSAQHGTGSGDRTQQARRRL